MIQSVIQSESKVPRNDLEPLGTASLGTRITGENSLLDVVFTVGNPKKKPSFLRDGYSTIIKL